MARCFTALVKIAHAVAPTRPAAATLRGIGAGGDTPKTRFVHLPDEVARAGSPSALRFFNGGG